MFNEDWKDFIELVGGGAVIVLVFFAMIVWLVIAGA